MGLFDNMISGVVGRASREIGNAIGSAVGTAATSVASQAVENYTTDQHIKNEQKKMALEEERKALNLPTNCPHCGAPTTGVNVCEYCRCKIVQ